MDRTHDGRKFRMLTVIDEFTRRCMAVVVERRLNSDNVLHCLTELFVQQRPAGSYPFRQRLRVYRSCRPRLARQDRRQDPLYRARVTLGERIQRELQLKAPGRNPEHGDLLYTEGGQSADRTMAASRTIPSGRIARSDTDRRPRKPSCQTLRGQPTLLIFGLRLAQT